MVSVDNFSLAESQWLEGLIAALPPGVVEEGVEAISDYFARKREEWAKADRETRPDPISIINGVGAAIGNELARELGLKWVVATDEGDPQAALFGRPDILVYPLAAAARRWSGDASGSIHSYYRGVVQQIRSLAPH